MTSPSDVWAFTSNFSQSRALRWNGSGWSVMRTFPGLGAWHFNGSAWTHSPGTAGLNGGSALSATSVWAYGGTGVAHWNGRGRPGIRRGSTTPA